MEETKSNSYYVDRYGAEFGKNMYIDNGQDMIDFPVTEALELAEKLSRKSDEALINALHGAHCYKDVDDTVDHKAFESSQQRITSLAVNFAINERQLIAPLFRADQRPLFKKHNEKVYKRIEVIYSRDRQLIDLHWWCCRARIHGYTDVTLGDIQLMIEGKIHSDGLTGAVMTEWSVQKKTEALLIPESEQTLLRLLRSARIRDLHSRVHLSQQKSEAAIRDYCIKSSQRKPSDATALYDDLHALKLSQKNIKFAVMIKSMMCGDVIPTEKMAAAETKMRRSQTIFRDKLGLIK